MKIETRTSVPSWRGLRTTRVLRRVVHLIRRLRPTGIRLTSFGLVGASGLLVNSLLLATFTDLAELHYLVSAILATQGSTLWNFWHCETWVFKDQNTDRPRLWRYMRFLLMNNLALGLRWPILFILTSGLGVHYVISNIASILVLSLVRYILSDRWIWANPRPTAPAPRYYDIHGLLRIHSPEPLPELESFLVEGNGLKPDMRLVIEGGQPQETAEA